jgi:hypothetical protein
VSFNRDTNLELLYENIIEAGENVFYKFLLEKDHRQKMMKFGITGDVAEYLHSIDDKYSIWFANQIKNMEGYQNSRSKVNWIQANLQTAIQGIMDWVKNTPNILLKNYNWEQAVEAQEDYHTNIKTKTLEGEEKNTILKTYDDGFYWVDLETSRCTEEANLMGHCASTGANTIYSLRRFTPETGIEAFVTIGASPDGGEWRQAKGKKNTHPKQEYYSYIADILVSKDMLRFRSEYDSKNDFDGNDLKVYIEENPEEFENPDEILEQIEEQNVSFEDFQKIHNDMEMDNLKYFSIYLDGDYVDEVGSVNHRPNVYFTMDTSKFGEFALNVERFIEGDGTDSGEDTPKSKAIMEALFDKDFYFEYVRVEVENGLITFHGDIQDDDSYSTVSDEGLKNYETFCEYFRNLDQNVDEDELFNNLVKYFIGEGVLPDPEDPETEEYIKPIVPEDPRQMKFSFGENVFYKFFEEIVEG